MIGPRFLAFVPQMGGSVVSENLAVEIGLALVHAGSRFQLFCDEQAACRWLAPNGVVVGALFPRKSKEIAPSSLIETECWWSASKVSNAALFWGAYAAFFESEDGEGVYVARDPGGALPVYFAHGRDGTFVASDVDLLLAAGVKLEIDDAQLWQHLTCPQMRTAQTALAAVSELMPGEQLELRGGQCRITTIWSPWRFAGQSEQYATIEDAVADVRTAVVDSVAAWSANMDHILLGVSGGLDSSIVAAALKACGARFSLYTLVTADPTGDERRYARSLANFLGAELAELSEKPGTVDIRVSEASHLPRPLARSFAQSGNRNALHYARERGADAFFSGGGGDSVFCYLTSTAPILDRVRVEGISGGWWQTVRDVSRLTDVSVAHVMRTMLPKLVAADMSYRWSRDMSFLAHQAFDLEGRELSHPWMSPPEDGLRGKSAHIAWIVGIYNYLEGFAHEQSYPVVFPLMSQPVVEACLRVPTWMWCRGGANRAVAREAFRDLLPPDILSRRSKGSFDGLVRQIFDGNVDLIRGMLLDGELARRGLIDRGQVERAMATPDAVDTLACARLMLLVDAEAWAQHWASVAGRSPQSAPLEHSRIRQGR